MISVHAKRARGLMARYIAENGIEDLEPLKQFDVEGYGFVESRSKSDVLVFDRPKNWADGDKKKRKGKKNDDDSSSTGNKTKRKRK